MRAAEIKSARFVVVSGRRRQVRERHAATCGVAAASSLNGCVWACGGARGGVGAREWAPVGVCVGSIWARRWPRAQIESVRMINCGASGVSGPLGGA